MLNFNEDTDPRSAVMIALGAASMCWEPRPSTEVFMPETCIAIGEELLEFLEKRFGQKS